MMKGGHDIVACPCFLAKTPLLAMHLLLICGNRQWGANAETCGVGGPPSSSCVYPTSVIGDQVSLLVGAWVCWLTAVCVDRVKAGLAALGMHVCVVADVVICFERTTTNQQQPCL